MMVSKRRMLYINDYRGDIGYTADLNLQALKTFKECIKKCDKEIEEAYYPNPNSQIQKDKRVLFNDVKNEFIKRNKTKSSWSKSLEKLEVVLKCCPD